METGFVLDREMSGGRPDRGSVSVEGLRYEEGRIKLKAIWEDLPPGRALTLVAFERPAPDSRWVQPANLALFRTVSGSGEKAGSVPIERSCTPFEIRVDAYRDGGLIERFTGPGGPATC